MRPSENTYSCTAFSTTYSPETVLKQHTTFEHNVIIQCLQPLITLINVSLCEIQVSLLYVVPSDKI